MRSRIAAHSKQAYMRDRTGAAGMSKWQSGFHSACPPLVSGSYRALHCLDDMHVLS